MKILIVSYYELKDFLLGIKKGFEKLGNHVTSYPLFQYAYDVNDKIENYAEHMNIFIKENKPDMILWWFIDVPLSVFEYIKTNNQATYVLYNSDDPINLNRDLIEKAKLFDIIITPCYESVGKYIMLTGNENVIFMPPGYDPEYFYSIYNEKYDCDINMYCYCLNDKYIEIITNITNYCDKEKKQFKLYGPNFMSTVFPCIYSGDIPYYSLNKLYNSSRINIVYQPKNNYIGDLIMQILSTNSTLITNADNKELILKDNVNCRKINNNNYIEVIRDVLNNKSYINGIKTAQNYTWENWTKLIYVKFCKLRFDPKLYKDVYNLNVDEDDLFDYWLSHGVNDKHICHSLHKTPDNFDDKSYCDYAQLPSNKSREYYYYHWFVHSKNEVFIKNATSETVKCNTPTKLIAQAYTAFINVHTSQDFKKLSLFCSNNPYIDINNMLDTFTKL